jgi:Zn-finger nucleic acid-binding protein
MEDEKDRFGETMRLMERAREDIYFAEKDRELIEKLKASLKRVERPEKENHLLSCPRCRGKLESYSFMDCLLDRCQSCGGIWMDKGELEAILKKVSRSPLAVLIDRFIARDEGTPKEEAGR